MSEQPLTLPAHSLLAGGQKHKKQAGQAWTAARCQRLLRQLQCRLVALRKLVNETRQPAAATITTTTRAKRVDTDEEPTRASKRARHTYGRRRSAPAQTNPTVSPLSTPPRTFRTLGSMKIERSPAGVGRIDFAKPSSRDLDHRNSTFDTSAKESGTNTKTLLIELQSIRRIVSESQYRIYETIFGSLNGLLRSTEPLSETAHPKSLLGMCLRKVPDALAVIEEWDRQSAAKAGNSSKWISSKASTELYEQLEGFGSTSLGWKSLKLVLRAHALCLLAAAVKEGLFESSYVRLLADLCLSLDCKEEAARLVVSLNVPLVAPRGSSGILFENSTIQPLGAILRSLQNQEVTGPSWDCLTTLISNKKLSLSWLTSRAFQPVWMRGVEILLHSRTPVPSTIDFMSTALNQLLLNDWKARGANQPSEEQTLVSVLAAITAAIWTLGAEMNGEEPWRTHALRRLLLTLESCISQQQTRRRGFHTSGCFIFVLAQFISTVMIDNDVVRLLAKNLSIHDSMKLLATARNGCPTQLQYQQTLLLACSAAQYQGRACGLPCHDVLSEIRTSLNGLGLPTWFQHSLVSDGAFVLAQKTKDLRDVAFAERFPASGKGTLEASTMFAGWRWEEGIGEWVLPSPSQKRRRELRQQDQGRDGANYGICPDRQADSRDRIAGPREKKTDRSSNFGYSNDKDSSVESDKGMGKHNAVDDADNTNGEDENASITDINERQDSGDELGDCAQTMGHNLGSALGQDDYDRSANRKRTKVKVVKKVKSLDITRRWQDHRLGRAVMGLSEILQGGDEMDDELSMLETI
ncbi:hypothetical protein DER45DRAFT_608543 [Fusarium avenaceum]|nr:hypothetical protein DER45DRAFT_608543 [Fusarium avenaceum]